MPDMMKAVVMRGPCGPEVLKVEQRSLASPLSGQVLSHALFSRPALLPPRGRRGRAPWLIAAPGAARS